MYTTIKWVWVRGCMLLGVRLLKSFWENLRVFDALTFSHVKKNELEAQIEMYIFIAYVKGVKRYKL